MRFQTYVFLVIGGLISLTVGAAVAAVSVVLNRAEVQKELLQLQRSRELFEELHRHRVSILETQSRVVAEEPRLKAVAATEGIDLRTADTVARELKSAAGCDLFVLANAAGGIVADSGDTDSGSSGLAVMPQAAVTLEGQEGSAIWTSHDRAYHVFARRLSFGEETVGFLILGYRIDRRIPEMAQAYTGSSFVVELNGQPIASSAHENGAAPDAFAIALERAFEQHPGGGEVSIGGERFIGSFGQFPGSDPAQGLRYVVARSLDRALEPSRQLVDAICAVALGLVLLAALIARIVAERLSTPLGELIAFTHRVASGELGARTPERGMTEMRTLSGAMNQMVAQLEHNQQTLLGAREAALDSSRAKSQFLANMSHEMRTPLNGVIGMTGLALESAVSSEQRTNLEMVRDSAIGLLGLIDGILDLSKIEARRLEIEDTPFDLPSMLSATLRPLAIRAQEKQLTLSHEIGPDVPQMIRGDSLRVRQILTNLVGNAVKFTERGEIKVRVERVEKAGSVTACFTVADSGIGIPQAHQQRIFEAFMQADQSMARRFGGTGLGLAISRQLVQLMGGRIWFESQERVGTTFHFAIPLRIAPDQPANLFRPRASAPDVEQPELSVLLAEDNVVNRKIAVRALEKLGHRVEVAENGRAALELFVKRPFDVVLMDIQMPEMDGYEATGAIREHEAARGGRIPIVALTAHAMSGDKERCLASGMDDYLAKPFRPQDLAATLLRVCGHAPGGATVAAPAPVAPATQVQSFPSTTTPTAS